MIKKVLGAVCLILMLLPTTVEQAHRNQTSVLLPETPRTSVIVTKIPSLTTTTTTTTIPPTTTTSMASTSTVVSSSSDSVWDIIARCETPPNGNWAYRGYYEGGLQFLPQSWTDYVAAGKPYGLIGYPAHAYEAIREQQIVVAIRIRDGVKGSTSPFLNAQGWNAWPTCRHKAGV